MALEDEERNDLFVPLTCERDGVVSTSRELPFLSPSIDEPIDSSLSKDKLTS